MGTSRKFALAAWLPALVVVLWWVGTAQSTSIYFPSLQSILETFGREWLSSEGLTNLLPSLINLVAGFLIASVLGVTLGVVIARFGFLAQLCEPFIHFLRSLPPPVLIPMAMLVLGVGTSMRISIIVIGAIWPTLLNTIEGVRGVDPGLTDAAHSYRVTGWNRLRFVMLPAASPQIFAGLRTTLQISIILIVVSEMVGATEGIGFSVLQAQQTFAVKETWAGTLLLGAVGYVCNVLFLRFENRIMHWQRGLRLQARAT